MPRIIVSEAGIGWRPHTKAIKTPALAMRLLDAGAFGVTCAKLGEAEVLADAGIRDILIANQLVGAEKMQRLAALRRRADPIVAVDCEGSNGLACPPGSRPRMSHPPRCRMAVRSAI